MMFFCLSSASQSELRMSNWLSSSEVDDDALHRGQLLRPSFYRSFLSRRWFYIAVPLGLISLAAFAMAVIHPSTYLSEDILIEDVRDRTERASSTTRFVAEELQKLQAENAALDARISEQRASLHSSAAPKNDTTQVNPLCQLRDEYAQKKSAFYSNQHPVLKSLKQQIGDLERTGSRVTASAAEG